MTRYAAKTTVPVENSRVEIERTLARYGAQSFAYGWDQRRALIEFTHQGRRIRFVLPLPDRSDKAFTHYQRSGSRYERSENAAREQWEQACRQHWRALALAIKAKLEVVEAGISTFEDEFMSQIVLPDNSTFGQWAKPQLESVYASGAMPALLPGASE